MQAEHEAARATMSRAEVNEARRMSSMVRRVSGRKVTISDEIWRIASRRTENIGTGAILGPHSRQNTLVECERSEASALIVRGIQPEEKGTISSSFCTWS
jgi:hypothetical protein